MRALRFNEKSPGLWAALGVRRHERKDLDGAEAAYKKALELNPGLSSVRVNQAFLIYERGRLENAAEEFLKALSLEPGLHNAHFGLALVYKAGDIERSREEFELFLKAVPYGAWADEARRHLRTMD